MDLSQQVERAANQIAEAIARRDEDVLLRSFAPNFVHRTPGGETRDASAFAENVRKIPGDIVFVRLDRLKVDLSGAGALVTGVQHAQVRIDGQDIDEQLQAFKNSKELSDGDKSELARLEERAATVSKQHARAREILDSNEEALSGLAKLSAAWAEMRIVDGRVPESLDSALQGLEHLTGMVRKYDSSNAKEKTSDRVRN